MGFTLPPECTADWVGEVGQPTSQDSDKRRKNMATMHMAKNLAQTSSITRGCYIPLMKLKPVLIASAIYLALVGLGALFAPRYFGMGPFRYRSRQYRRIRLRSRHGRVGCRER